jgi:MFS family permease
MENVEKGNFLMLFKNGNTILKYLKCILIALPVWFGIGILISLSPEFGREKGFIDPIQVSKAVMFTYAGAAAGDIVCGLLSQWMKSRKKILLYYLLFTIVCVLAYLYNPSKSLSVFYTICFFLGAGIGYWAVFVTIAAEQFGTNIRATVTTTVPNFVRGSLVPLSILFTYLRSSQSFSFVNAALLVGMLAISLALISWYYLDETFGKELNYTE